MATKKIRESLAGLAEWIRLARKFYQLWPLISVPVLTMLATLALWSVEVGQRLNAAPWWFILLVYLVVWPLLLGVSLIVIKRTLQIPSQPVWFLAQGFYWKVLPTFFNQHHLYSPNSSMTHMTLHNIFQGPYCANHEDCSMLVDEDLLAGAQTCSRCGAPLNPGKEIRPEGPRHGVESSASHDPLWPLRKTAFREAIAELDEGKLKPKP